MSETAYVAPSTVCYTCKKQVGTSILLFEELINDGFEEQDALDALQTAKNLHRECCRRTLLTELDPYSMMNPNTAPDEE